MLNNLNDQCIKKDLLIPHILNKLIGQKVSVIEQTHGSFITIDFGTLTERKGKRRTYLVGQYHLWVYMCAWRIDKDDKPLVASSDSREKISDTIKIITGTTLTNYVLNSSLDAQFSFDNNINLTLFNTSTQDEEQWMLYLWEQDVRYVLVIGPGNSWYYEPSSYPRRN